MKRQLITALLTISAIVSIARAEMVPYTSADKRITIKHPEEWQPAEGLQAGVIARFVSPQDGEGDKYREEFTIKVIEMNQQADIHELVDAIKPGMAQSLPGYVEKSDDQLTIAGRPGRKIVGEVTTQFSPIRSTQWFVIDGTQLFIITLNATPATADGLKAIGEAMMETLTIEKKS